MSIHSQSTHFDKFRALLLYRNYLVNSALWSILALRFGLMVLNIRPSVFYLFGFTASALRPVVTLQSHLD